MANIRIGGGSVTITIEERGKTTIYKFEAGNVPGATIKEKGKPRRPAELEKSEENWFEVRF